VADAASDEPFDLASLPSIESIAANTDIAAFLRAGVPAELTRAALRKAWTSDPAIRDFIGIAENQWDFNDPHAMPGFGPLRATDQIPALLCRVLGDQTLDETLVGQAISTAQGSATPVDVVSRVPEDGGGGDDPDNREKA